MLRPSVLVFWTMTETPSPNPSTTGLLVAGGVKVGSEGGRMIVALLDRTVTEIV